MAEPALGRSALSADYRLGRHGAGAQVRLVERRGLAKIHVAGDPGNAAVLAAIERVVGARPPLASDTAATGDGATILWLAPDRWLVVAPGRGREDWEARLASALAPTGAAVTEVSHGRTAIRISGPKARELLAKGCPLDLHRHSFKPGDCAQSSLARINVLLHAVDAVAIDVYVARSYALTLWEWLVESAAEFGCEVAEAETA